MQEIAETKLKKGKKNQAECTYRNLCNQILLHHVCNKFVIFWELEFSGWPLFNTTPKQDFFSFPISHYQSDFKTSPPWCRGIIFDVNILDLRLHSLGQSQGSLLVHLSGFAVFNDNSWNRWARLGFLLSDSLL